MFRITGAKGFHITFENGWTVSVQFGPGNYCDNFRADVDGDPPQDGWQSSTAEIAAWNEKNESYEFEHDTMNGGIPANDVLAFMVMVSQFSRDRKGYDPRQALRKIREEIE